MQASTVILLQVERLVLPKALGLDALALFGVLASIGLAPFRMLQSGLWRTLLPRLRGCPTPRSRRALLLREAGVATASSVVATLGVFAFGPLVVRILVGEKYALGTELLVSAVVTGWVKVLSTFVDAVALAVSGTREIAILNGAGWPCVALAAGGAVAGARRGVAGLYGAPTGWLVRALIAAWLSAPYLRDRAVPRPRPDPRAVGRGRPGRGGTRAR